MDETLWVTPPRFKTKPIDHNKAIMEMQTGALQIFLVCPQRTVQGDMHLLHQAMDGPDCAPFFRPQYEFSFFLKDVEKKSIGRLFGVKRN